MKTAQEKCAENKFPFPLCVSLPMDRRSTFPSFVFFVSLRLSHRRLENASVQRARKRDSPPSFQRKEIELEFKWIARKRERDSISRALNEDRTILSCGLWLLSLSSLPCDLHCWWSWWRNESWREREGEVEGGLFFVLRHTFSGLELKLEEKRWEIVTRGIN